MSKYILVFKSQSDWSTLPKDQIEKVMQAWGEWVGKIAPSIVDEGETFKPSGKQVSNKGIEKADDFLSGYIIVEAKDFDEALRIAQSSQTVARGGTVQVYEAFGI